MSGALHVPDSQLDSPLGRVSPIVKLGVALAWLAGMALTLDARPPLLLAAAAVVAATTVGAVAPSRYLRGAAPLLLAAVSIGLFNTLFSESNDDPGAKVLMELGPVRIVEAAVLAGVGIFTRILAMAATAVTFSQTTDSTRLVDSLVRQARVSARFGYGALAAYQAIPRLLDDLGALRASRRIRGLRFTWHPRILLGLLVRAIRHGDALALAMDARAFGAGARTWYRELRWSLADAVVAAAGLGLLYAALRLPG
jgi:energy-coupling factor transporter transmembrane protein EcfT